MWRSLPFKKDCFACIVLGTQVCDSTITEPNNFYGTVTCKTDTSITCTFTHVCQVDAISGLQLLGEEKITKLYSDTSSGALWIMTTATATNYAHPSTYGFGRNTCKIKSLPSGLDREVTLAMTVDILCKGVQARIYEMQRRFTKKTVEVNERANIRTSPHKVSKALN